MASWPRFSANPNPHAHGPETGGPPDEDAYRRGFQQGAEEALRAVKGGVPSPRLERWRLEVYRWRFQKTHKRRWPPPPVIPPTKIRAQG